MDLEFGHHQSGCWNIFESCHGSEETKCIAGYGGKTSLYDVQNVGRISSENGASRYPTVSLAQSDDNNIAIATGETLHILGDGGSTSKATVTLGSSIDALCFRPDGNIVVAVDSSGVIHLILVESGKVFFSHKIAIRENSINLNGNEQEERKLFCSVTCSENRNQDGTYFIGVGLTNSKMITFSNVRLTELEKACEKNDVETIRNAQMSMKMTEYDTSVAHGPKMTSMIAIDGGYCQKYATTGNGVIALWTEDIDIFMSDQNCCNFVLESCTNPSWNEGSEIIKIFHLYQHLYSLDSKGTISQWDATTLVLIRYWQNTGICDFSITDSGSRSSDKSAKLYAIAKDDSTGDMNVCVFELPLMTKNFSCKCSGQKINILATGTPFLEDIVYVEAIGWYGRLPSFLELRRVSEAIPEHRLLRLLSKRKFDDAEKFAALYNLDAQQVHQQKAAFLADTIAELDEDEEPSMLKPIFDDLMRCLEKLHDDTAIAEICLETIIPNVHMNYALLALGRSRLSHAVHAQNGASNGTETKEQKNDLLLQIINRMDRLVTFQVTDGYSEENGEDWVRFCSTDLPIELIRLLACKNISAAATVLLRHKACFLAFLERSEQDTTDTSVIEKRLQAFLDHIPDMEDVDSVIGWLENSLLPTLLPRIPCSLKVLATWLHVKAESFEHSNPSNWPENGLKMANVLFNFQNNVSGVGFMRNQLSAASEAYKSTSEEVAKLRLLASRLQLLLQLKQKYKCNVSLAEFIEETTMSLTYRMLDRVMAPELIPSVLQNTIRPYMREHGLSEEEVLLGYIEDLLNRFCNQSWRSFESLRERKIVGITQCIMDSDVFLEAVVKVAKKASVPWSDDVRSLVDKGIQIAESTDEEQGLGDADCTLELLTKRETFLRDLKYSKHIEQLPIILAEYGLPNVKMRSAASQEQFVNFLIRQDTKEALDQANHFCRTFTTISIVDFYKFRLIHLLMNEKTDDCLSLLQEAENESTELSISLVKRMITLTEIYLKDKEEAENRTELCNVAMAMIEHVLKKLQNNDDEKYNFLRFYFNEKLDLLRNVAALQTQCGEYVTVDEYRDKDFRESLVARKIEQYGSSDTTETDFEVTTASENSNNSLSTGAAVQTFTSIYPDHTMNATRSSDGAGKESDTKLPSLSLCHVLNVARILQVPSNKLRGWIALTAAKNSENGVLTAVRLCRELLMISPTEDAGNVSLQVVAQSIKNLTANNRDVMKQLSKVLGLAAHGVMFCKPENITEGIVMCKFASLCNELMKNMDSDNGLFTHSVTPAMKDPYSTVSTLYPWIEEGGGLMLQTDQVTPVFKKIMVLLSGNANLFTANLSQDTTAVESTLAEFRSLAFHMTSTLQGARQSQLSLVWLASCISFTLKCVANMNNSLDKAQSDAVLKKLISTIEEVSKVVPDYVEDCIKKVLYARNVDVGLIVGYLALLPIVKAQKILQSELTKAGNNSKRIMCIARAGIHTLRLHGMSAEIGRFEHLFLDARWGELLQPLKIPFDQAYFGSQSSKSSTLSKLIYHPEATGKMIRSFCLDYDLDSISALLEFARVLLSDPSCLVASSNIQKLSESEGALISIESLKIPRVDMQMTAWENKKKTVIEHRQSKEPDCNRPWDGVQKEMAFVMEKVTDKRVLCDQLISILRRETVPYYYKRAKYILNLIGECKTIQSEVDVGKGLQLIECLKLFKRSASVSEYERKHWNLAGELRLLSKLPEISHQRLPLHPFLFGGSSSAWKILTPELNEHTASKLAAIANILSLSVDKLYMTAADNFIRSHMDKDNEHQLSMTVKQLTLVQNFTQEVKDFRMAAALAKKIAESLPISKQKVMAYDWCTNLAERWRQSLSSDNPEFAAVVNTHRNLRRHYRGVAVELELHKHNLLSENVFALTSSPEKLVLLLYQHPSILKRYFKPDAEAYPDIHEATNAIADIHSLNIFKLRMSISLAWLLASTATDENTDEDSTINLQNMRAAAIVNSDSETSSSMDSEVIRLLYVLSHMPTKQTAKLLLGFAFDRKNPRITNGCRVRALQCVLQLFDDDLIEGLTNEKVSTIREKLRLLVYLSELESIGFGISGAQLQGGKKEDIARSIYATPKFRHDSRAICIAAELCREFNSWCPNTWQVLLQQLVALKQISYLRHLLPDICCHATISSLPCLATVWQSCVTFPLTAMTPPLDEEKAKIAIASYHFLLACPVLLQIDLISIAKHFCAVEFPLLALGCLRADPSQNENSKKLALANYDVIEEQLKNHPNLLGHAKILRFLRVCKF